MKKLRLSVEPFENAHLLFNSPALNNIKPVGSLALLTTSLYPLYLAGNIKQLSLSPFKQNIMFLIGNKKRRVVYYWSEIDKLFIIQSYDDFMSFVMQLYDDSMDQINDRRYCLQQDSSYQFDDNNWEDELPF